jgi:hypothetical protein
MPHVAGRLRIGFEAPAGHAYHTLTDAQMKNLKVKITSEIANRVAIEYRNTWNSVDIEVDAGGHRPESELRDWLLANLPGLTGAPAISLPSPASFASVRYTIWNTDRICEHCHDLTLDGNAWIVTSDDDPQVSVQLVVQIGWGIPF